MTVRANSSWIGVTVSSGTLKPEDLLLVFVDTIDSVYDANETSPDEDLQALLDHAAALDTDDDSKADEISDTINALMAELDKLAPEGCAFGTHDGDSALFGFWLAESEDDDGKEE